jgi:hypothetical protein
VVENADELKGFPATFSVNGNTYLNVSLTKEFPKTLFIKHDGGTTFIDRGDLSPRQVNALLSTKEPGKNP